LRCNILFYNNWSHTADSPLIISEFRLRGPNGANDEFIEIYNNTDTAHIVTASDGSPGYGVFASDGVMRFFIPNGTVIPARGHFLGANSAGYSLSNYPAGNSTTAIADANWTTDISDNSGIALFTSTNAPVLSNRLDAVGCSSVANTLYREGVGLPSSLRIRTARARAPDNDSVRLDQKISSVRDI